MLRAFHIDNGYHMDNRHQLHVFDARGLVSIRHKYGSQATHESSQSYSSHVASFIVTASLADMQFPYILESISAGLHQCTETHVVRQ